VFEAAHKAEQPVQKLSEVFCHAGIAVSEAASANRLGSLSRRKDSFTNRNYGFGFEFYDWKLPKRSLQLLFGWLKLPGKYEI
jgi:hypothetical protein